ncbi:Mur ligase domain-containing protein, partial [Klebsiella pneumoniae]|uniref:Mur ligase domain-containing protein n=1 Tax=Klebsiella pneumoniae TaxID=573 RepID=UPI0025A2BE71
QLVCKDGCEQINIKGAVLDSRLVEEGYLFFATKGEKVDGHSFIGQVAEKKAACVVCEKAPENADIPYILVEDSFVALKQV